MKTDYNLEERLVAFAVDVVNFVDALPKNSKGKYFGGQLLRSGSSPALNYGEAQAAESPKDFVHKMRLCLKELRESQVCLKIIDRGRWFPGQNPAALLDECSQLVAIFAKSVNTAEKRLPNKDR